LANQQSPTVAARARHRIALRLLPYLFILYIIAFLDRTNISSAALEIPRELGFSDNVIGVGSGIFFIGYLLLEIPGAGDCRALERSAMDCPHHGDLGPSHSVDGVYPHTSPVLHCSLFVGSG